MLILEFFEQQISVVCSIYIEDRNTVSLIIIIIEPSQNVRMTISATTTIVAIHTAATLLLST